MDDEWDNLVNSMQRNEGAPLPPFYKFEKPGDYVSGLMEPIRTISSPQAPGGTAQIADLSTKNGVVTVTLTADLKRKLVDLPGKFVAIKFIGWRNGKTKEFSTEPRQGQPWFKEFEVYSK